MSKGHSQPERSTANQQNQTNSEKYFHRSPFVKPSHFGQAKPAAGEAAGAAT
jgi:hypothetical protein